MACYRKDEFVNTDLALLQYAACIEQYPNEVIESATSPRSGLQTQCTFPPSLAELKAFCERSLRSFLAIHRVKFLKENPIERPAREAEIDPEERRQSVEMLKAKYPWMFRDSRRNAPVVARPLSEIMRECGVTQEQFDAIPNAKPP